MLSLLTGIGSILFSCYAAFCWGAEWARHGADRRARVDHDEALRLRGQASEALRLHEMTDALDDRQHRDLLAELRRREENLMRRQGAANHAWFEATNWSSWAPWVEYTPLRERLRDLRDWVMRRTKRRESLLDKIRGEQDAAPTMTDDDRRMLDAVKRRVLKGD